MQRPFRARGEHTLATSAPACAALIASLLASACGGEVGAPPGRRSDVPVAPGYSPGGGDLPDAGRVTADAGSREPQAPVLDEPVPFDELVCPPRPPTEVMDNQCDPSSEPSGCPEGEGCAPFVIYPDGPCDEERVVTVCTSVGEGTQGDACGRNRCAAGHVCVKTERGTLCSRVCRPGVPGANVCALGLLCLPIDIEGFGGCL